MLVPTAFLGTADVLGNPCNIGKDTGTAVTPLPKYDHWPYLDIHVITISAPFLYTADDSSECCHSTMTSVGISRVCQVIRFFFSLGRGQAAGIVFDHEFSISNLLGDFKAFYFNKVFVKHLGVIISSNFLIIFLQMSVMLPYTHQIGVDGVWWPPY